MEWTIASLAEVIRVECTVPQVEPLVGALLSTYPHSEQSPTRRFRLTGGAEFTLWRDHSLRYTTRHAEDLVAAFELDLYRTLLASAGGDLVLHAAAFVSGARSVLLAGPSGSGKSTLTSRLVERGFAYASDEWSVIDRDLRVRGVPRPIVLSGGRRVTSSLPTISYSVRNRFGRKIASDLVQPPPERICTETCDLGATVFLAHPRPRPTGLSPLSPERAFRRLQNCVLSGKEALLDTTAALLTARPVYELGGDTDQAVAALAEAFSEA